MALEVDRELYLNFTSVGNSLSSLEVQYNLKFNSICIETVLWGHNYIYFALGKGTHNNLRVVVPELSYKNTIYLLPLLLSLKQHASR